LKVFPEGSKLKGVVGNTRPGKKKWKKNRGSVSGDNRGMGKKISLSPD